MPATLRAREDYRAFRIAEGDTNYMIPLADPVADGAAGVGFTAIVEVYARGGRTPPNTHERAHELFFVLAGTGTATFDGEDRDLRPGDTIILEPGTEHVIANTGLGKLCTLTVMVPNEAFAEMIHNGTPVDLDAEDRGVIARLRR